MAESIGAEAHSGTGSLGPGNSMSRLPSFTTSEQSGLGGSGDSYVSYTSIVFRSTPKTAKYSSSAPRNAPLTPTQRELQSVTNSSQPGTQPATTQAISSHFVYYDIGLVSGAWIPGMTAGQ